MSFRIAVVGSGAIGLYYGGKLAAAGSDVHFLMRGPLDEVRRSGLRIRGEGEDIHVANVNCYETTNEIGVSGLVLIAVKTTSNADLIDLLPPLLDEKTMLVTMQNGLGNEEFLAAHFGADRVLGALCFICLNRTSRSSIERYEYGQVVLGEFGRGAQPRTEQIKSQFQAAGIQCRLTNDLAMERWRKLVWNIPFNGLSIVAGGLDTQAILCDPKLYQLTLALMHEVIAGANQCGLALELSAAVEQIEATKRIRGYKPSTLQDFETGKPLEIEAIWGEPLRRAVQAGASMPRLEMLYALLDSVESRKQRSSGN